MQTLEIDLDLFRMAVTKYGHSWEKNTGDNPVSKETRKLLIAEGLTRAGLSFYALRHTTQTIGEESHDAAAVKAIMGHVPESDDMSANYRQRMTDARLERVANHIHGWLFGE